VSSRTGERLKTHRDRILRREFRGLLLLYAVFAFLSALIALNST